MVRNLQEHSNGIEYPFDTVEGRKLTWVKFMGRQAFLVTVALVAFAASAPAQCIPTESGSPFVVEQQAPVYLKSLTSAREKADPEAEDLESDVLVYHAIDRIARAFSTGDAARLQELLVTGKRKISLSLETGDSRQGHYGPGQVLHIFERLFGEVDTREFDYDSREVERYSGAAVFRADWTYVVVDTDERVTERLHFKLEQDDDEWRIYEIRAATR